MNHKYHTNLEIIIILKIETKNLSLYQLQRMLLKIICKYYSVLIISPNFIFIHQTSC